MNNKFFYLFFFVIIIALSRIIPHPPNFTPILASAIMSPMLIKNKKFAIMLPLLAMFISDLIIGFHIYQSVVYFSILIIILFSSINKKNYISLIFTVLVSCVLFFILTNFAVWVAWDYYPKTFIGLLNCYTLAIPFFYNTLISTFIFTLLIRFFIKQIEEFNLKTSSFIFGILKKNIL